MNEYLCLDCGRTFDEPRRYVERHGLDSSPYEEMSCCPYCGGSYRRAIYCDGCGEAIGGEYVQVDPSGNCYCDACYMLRSIFN